MHGSRLVLVPYILSPFWHGGVEMEKNGLLPTVVTTLSYTMAYENSVVVS